MFLYGFGFVWVSYQVADIDVFISTFKQRLIDCHKQNWNHLIQDSSRCIHYKEFKSLLNTERYLKMNLPAKYRQALLRFRCANHTLNVELVRQNKIPFEQHIYQFCFQNDNVSVVECEFHMFFCCTYPSFPMTITLSRGVLIKAGAEMCDDKGVIILTSCCKHLGEMKHITAADGMNCSALKPSCLYM